MSFLIPRIFHLLVVNDITMQCFIIMRTDSFVLVYNMAKHVITCFCIDHIIWSAVVEPKNMCLFNYIVHVYTCECTYI